MLQEVKFQIRARIGIGDRGVRVYYQIVVVCEQVPSVWCSGVLGLEARIE